MVVSVRDIPGNQDDTLAHRIRQAREEAGLSRSKLAEATGISMRTIEKYEYGSSEPPVSRLNKLAEALEVDREWLLVGDDALDELQGSPEPEPGRIFTSAEIAIGLLEVLEDLRERRFEKKQRRALATMDAIQMGLKMLDPDELLEIAMAQGVYQPACSSAEDLDELFQNDPMDGQEMCLEIQERIVDTAVLGADLFALEREQFIQSLAKIAEENERIEDPLFWGPHEKFVPRVRAELRRLALTGGGPDFDDTKTFPRRSDE